MDPVNDFLLRANQRSKILGDLDTSVFMEDQENSNANTTSTKISHGSTQSQGSFEVSVTQSFTYDSGVIPEIDSSANNDSGLRSPLRSVNKVSKVVVQDSPAPTSPLKSKFAKLSEGLKNYEVDLKPNAKPKEDYIHGPTKRISMSGDIPATTFFAPKQTSSPAADVIAPKQIPSPLELFSPKETSSHASDISPLNQTSLSTSNFFTPKHASSPLHNSSIESASYGGKVNALKQVFNKSNPPSEEKQEKFIDNTRMNFSKAKNLFDTPAAASNVGHKFESPYGMKREQVFTNIRRYDDPNPTKKPAQCEIVTGPTFSQSKNYWKNRERENPSADILETANNLFKPRYQPTPKGGFLSALKAPYQPNAKYSSEKPTAMQEARKLVSFSDDVFEIDEGHDADEDGVKTAMNTSWAESFNVKSMVVTESCFSSLASSKEATATESAVSLSVPSDSFDYQQSPPPQYSGLQKSSFSSPIGPSLLDDINKDFTKIHTPRSQPTSFNEDGNNTSKPALVYSLSKYRKAESTPQRIVNESKDVVEEMMSPTVTKGDDMIRLLSAEYIQTKLREIEYSQTVVTDHIYQTEKALNVARQQRDRKDEKISVSSQEIELLQKLATLHERRRAYYLEIGRLSNSTDLYYIIPRAKITFTKIAVDVQRHLQVANHHHAYLFVMLRYNDQVESTQPILINDIIARGVGAVEFPDHLEINNVSPDFVISIEVYGITLVRKDYGSDSRFSLKRMVSSPQPDRSYINEAFARIGQHVIQKSDLAAKVLALSTFETPLQGHIRLSSVCQTTDPDDSKWSGFVSIYRVVDGKGAWEYCYSTISNSHFKFWRYPEDADTKDPLLSLNLRDMVENAQPISDARLNFQNDFEVKIVDINEKVVPIMLSAAEERDRERIINIINRSFKYSNTWRSHQ